MHQTPDANHRDGFRNMVGGGVSILRALATSVEVFLHRPGTLGERYFEGLHIGVAMLIIAIWPAFCRPIHDFEWVYMFLGWFVAFCIAHKARINIRVKQGGPQPHSRYTGRPWVMSIFRRMSEATAKCVVEPVLTALIGAVIAQLISPPVGGYLMVAALGLFISNNLPNRLERRRALDMHDAFMDQQNVVDRFRNMRGQ